MRECKFEYYHCEAVRDAIVDDLDYYTDNPDHACADLVRVTSLLEVLYIIGYEAEARTLRKELKARVKEECNTDDKEMFFDECKKLSF